MTRSEVRSAAGAVARIAGTAAVLGAVVFLLHPGVRLGYASLYDEGNITSAGWRVAAGDVLYRDLWTMHAPGTAYVLGAAFKAFGASLVVERAVRCAALGLLAAVGYALFSRFLGRVWALAAVALALGAQLDLTLRTRDLALAAFAACLLLAAGALEEPGRPWRLSAAGLLAGLTACFRQDFGLYAALAVTAAAVLGAGVAPLPFRAWWRPLALFWVMAAVPVLLAIAYFASQGALTDLYRQTIVFPALHFVEVRGLPAPSPFAVHRGLAFGPLFWACPAVMAAAGALALTPRGRSRGGTAVLLVALGGLLVFARYSFVRADPAHLRPSLFLAVPLWLWLGKNVGEVAGAGNRRVASTAALATVLAGTLALTHHVVRAQETLTRWAPAAHVERDLRAAGVALDPLLSNALRYVDANAPAGAPLFVGNARHDVVDVSCSLCYFLLQRPNPSRYYNLHPGLATTRGVQEEIVESIEEAAVGWVLLWSAPLGQTDAGHAPVTLLDDHLRDRFEVVAEFGPWQVRGRRYTRGGGQ